MITRPKHWIKNLLVFALPLSDGLLVGQNFRSESIYRATAMFFSLCAMSSANYIFNDIKDVKMDKLHSAKKHRPIAAGEIPIPLAFLQGLLLIFLSLLLSLIVSGLESLILVCVFGSIQGLYTVSLKHLSGYDIVTLALLYVYRSVIPAFYEDVPLSQWFLLIFFAGALYLATGKRLSELRNSHSISTRKVLNSYTESQLSMWVGISLTLLIVSYLNWIFTLANTEAFIPMMFSIVPIFIFLIRMTAHVLSASGQDPTRIIFNNKDSFVLGFIWLALYLNGKGYL